MADVHVLNVFLYDDLIGTMTSLPGGKNLFAFDSDYIEKTKRPVLSLSFKDVYGDLITDVKTTQTRVPPFFANLLPEGRLRDYLAERAGVKPQREFFLLWALGKDLPGALKVLPAKGQRWPAKPLENVLEVESGDKKKIPLRFSLAGVQLKFSAVEKARGGLTIPADGVGGSWIVKLPSTKFNDVPENEYLMMELARRVGMDVPETKLISISKVGGLPKGIEHLGKYAFAIKRFDRGKKRSRVHMEDFAQVFGLYPEKKYKSASYRNIAKVIWAETGEKGIVEFVRRFVFNALIGNADMHLKNWSLLYLDRNSVSLAPAYDFVSTVVYLPDDQLALNFVDSKAFESVSTDQFSRFSAKVGLPDKLILDAVKGTVEAFKEVWNSADDLSITSEVRSKIENHLSKVPIFKEM